MGILDGKAAVVTGGGRGIGRGHCLHLAQQGAAVIVNDVDGAEAQKVVDEIAEAGGRAQASAADIGTRAGARALIAQCADAFGAIHAMVNNAGNLRDRSFLKMSDDDLGDVLRVHVQGTFMCAQEAALRMRDQRTGGAIVNTVSAAHFGNFGQTNYGAAKGAIASMTYTWALELARFGIRVNAISPSGTTRMSATYRGPDGKEIPLPFLDPLQNGAMVAYLCSDEASWISGQVFGTGADRVALLQQPKYGSALFKSGGLTVDDLRAQVPVHLKAHLERVGLMKPPYPFYDGVKPADEAAR
jgi:NAD(P)-dependent dehydrogenase (short-subunit alcohol dehydrogenase family)